MDWVKSISVKIIGAIKINVMNFILKWNQRQNIPSVLVKRCTEIFSLIKIRLISHLSVSSLVMRAADRRGVSFSRILYGPWIVTFPIEIASLAYVWF